MRSGPGSSPQPPRREPCLGQGRLAAITHQFQDFDSRVVVMQHVALGRLPDHLCKDRLGTLGLGLHDVPLGRGGQRNPQVSWRCSPRWKGIPFPYFSRAIMLPTVVSYFFSAPTPAGGSAVNTTPQRPQRSFWR